MRLRTVRIFQPARNTMQSGGAKGNKWRLDWDILPGGGRWENHLMGWASSCVARTGYMAGCLLSGQRGLHAGHPPVVPHQGGRHRLCRASR
jgi:hypothetical protein